MSLLSGQPVPLEPLRTGEGAVGPPSAELRPFPTANPKQAPFRIDLRRSLQMHSLLALGISLTGVALGLGYFLTFWPIYAAQCLVYVEPTEPASSDQGGNPRWTDGGTTYETFIQQQMVGVTRREVLTGALHKLAAGTWQAPSESEQAAVDRLRRATVVTRVGDSYQFSIGARASNADVAARLSNAVAASFVENASRKETAGDAQRLSLLREVRERVQKELTADRIEQEALNKQQSVAATGTALRDRSADEIERAHADLVKARNDRDEAAARLTSMDAGAGTSSTALDAEVNQLIAGDSGLVGMKASLDKRRANLTAQMAGLTPSNPQYKQDAAELAQVSVTLDTMLKDLRTKAAAQIQEGLHADLEQTAAAEDQLNAQLRQLAAAASGAAIKQQRSSDLTTDIARLESLYSTVDDQWRKLMIEDGAPGAPFLVAAAVPPLRPADTGLLLGTAIVMALLGVLLGIVVSVILNKMDSRVYMAADVERVLGFPPMAQLPDFDEVSGAVSSEYLLRLSAAIEYACHQSNLRTWIFTGAGSGAGATTLATRVTEMLESLGKSAVLVLASGSAGNVPGQPDTQRGTGPKAVLHRMAEVTENNEARIALTDTEPLADSEDTELLARSVDCAIVVIESGVTTRPQLRELAETLLRLDVAAVGFVLNRVKLERADSLFRQSVQAIEKHLIAQGKAIYRRTARSRSIAAEVSSTPEPIPGQAVAKPQAELAVPSPIPAREPRIAEPDNSTYAPVARPTSAPLYPRQAPQFAPPRLAQASRPPSPQGMPIQLGRDREDRPSAGSGPISPVPRPIPSGLPGQNWERQTQERATNLQPGGSPWGPTGDGPLEETASERETRLSGGLRNLLFGLGLKNLNRTSELGEENSEFLKQLDRAIEPPMYAQSGASRQAPAPANTARSNEIGEWSGIASQKVEPPRAEPPRVEPPKIEAPRVEPARVEAVKVQPARGEWPRADLPGFAPQKPESPQFEPPRNDPKFDLSEFMRPKVEPPTIDSRRIESSRPLPTGPAMSPVRPLVETAEKTSPAESDPPVPRDRDETFREVDILPSRRGQYQRK